jgi:hypothetical protein
MAFLITRDHIADTSEPEGTNLNAVGVLGPRTITDAEEAALKANGGTAFRMYDDDGELYYAGRYLGDPNSEEAFEPLECFGTPNAGAVRIDYRQPSGKWETL